MLCNDIGNMRDGITDNKIVPMNTKLRQYILRVKLRIIYINTLAQKICFH